MAAILPLFCFLSILLIFRKFQILGWRGSFLLAALLWGFLLTAITEILSLFTWLDFWHVLVAWGIVLLLLLLILVFGNRKHGDLRLNLHLINLSRFELSSLIFLFLIVVVIGVAAWVAPPNTWDSMTYHMARVIHWIQNKSVSFYPTNILRQLHSNPWSEFAILHFQILDGSDRYANFIQWFSMVGSIVGVSLVAKELKATIRGQIFAAVVCATIPMGILQGSTTQTDYVVAFWLVCFIYFSMLLKKETNLLYALATGAAMGLAILTKATAYVFIFPFLAWLGLSSIKSRHTKKILFVALALVFAFVINLGHYARNYDLYGSPLGPGKESTNSGYANEIYTFSSVTSNILRNVALHLGTPSSQVNTAFENSINWLHTIIGISPNDVRTTWAGTEFQVPRISFHEDTAGNALHLFLITASLLVYAFWRSKERDVTLFLYILSLLLAFLLFCAYLKWQPWNSRLHLPLFVLFAPFLGLMFSRIRNLKMANLLMVIIMVMALPWVFHNASKPFFGKNSIFTRSRIEQYFKPTSEWAGPYNEAAQILSDLHCSNVGLVIGEENLEYPLWVLLREKTNGTVRLEHVNVTNISQRKYDVNHLNTFNPCAIFTLSADSPKTISVGNIVYLREWSSHTINIYTQILSP